MCAFVVLIILLIVLAVKLRHRNLELDDLYDEYGIDLEEEPEKVKQSQIAVKKEVAAEPEDEYLDYYEDDEYEEYEEDEYEEDEYEEESSNDYYYDIW